MFTCKKTALLIAQSVDEVLPWHKAIPLQFHLLICGACATLKKELTALSDATAHFTAEEAPSLHSEAPVRLSQERAEAIKRCLDNEDTKN